MAGNTLFTPRNKGFVEYKIKTIDKMGKEVESSVKNLPFDLVTISQKREMNINDKIIENYSLILFDFGKSDKVELLEKFALSWINLAIMQGHGRNMAFRVVKR